MGSDPPAGAVLLDVGGTTLRIGRRDAAGAVSGVRRVPTEGIARCPGGPVPVLQHRVADQVAREVERAATPETRAVGISFAGPVTADGVVTAAPTVWGSGGAPLALADRLRARLGRPVLLVNDLTAAAWRYAGTVPDPFCVITVSSGIGNKVFHAGRVMVGADGLGGELGHWTCDPAADAPRCDCGGRGHLGAIASGRGAVATARRLRDRDSDVFAGSALAGRTDFDAPELARAFVAGDRFATAVLRAGLRHLATAISVLFAAAGLRRFVIIGGFALGIGPPYLAALTEELARLGCFGLPADRIGQLVTLGEPDDLHGLIGVGRMLGEGGAGCAC